MSASPLAMGALTTVGTAVMAGRAVGRRCQQSNERSQRVVYCEWDEDRGCCRGIRVQRAQIQVENSGAYRCWM